MTRLFDMYRTNIVWSCLQKEVFLWLLLSLLPVGPMVLFLLLLVLLLFTIN